MVDNLAERRMVKAASPLSGSNRIKRPIIKQIGQGPIAIVPQSFWIVPAFDRYIRGPRFSVARHGRIVDGKAMCSAAARPRMASSVRPISLAIRPTVWRASTRPRSSASVSSDQGLPRLQVIAQHHGCRWLFSSQGAEAASV